MPDLPDPSDLPPATVPPVTAPPALPPGAAPVAVTPSLTDILIAFVTMSLSGFGGVLPFARRTLVEERRWMTAAEFNDAFALSQFLPGPNIVNFSVVFGARFRGLAGAAVALFGLVTPPLLIVIGIGILYARYGEIAALARALTALAAAAAGLIIATVIKMALPLVEEGLSPAPVFGLLAFVAVGLLRWPMHWVLLALIPLSIGVAFFVHRRTGA
jgi:chromate transporter